MNFVNFDESGPVFEVVEELMGLPDEVLDAKFLKTKDDAGLNEWVALATNSETLKFYNYEQKKVKFVPGHRDIVLCLDIWEDMIVTGSKDMTVKLWKAKCEKTGDSESSKLDVRLLATFKGHMEGILSLNIGPKKGNFVVSTSSDKSLKIWELSEQITKTERSVTVNFFY
jgi:WD40 repeat protein